MEQIAWPVTSKKLGDGQPRRSTTDTAKEIWASALKARRRSSRLMKEKDWRHKYPEHVVGVIETSIQAGKEVEAARAALETAHQKFIFPDESGLSMKSAIVRGRSDAPKTLSDVSVELDGKVLQGEELLVELRKVAETGCMEPSLPAELERAFMSNGGGLLDKDTVYVVLGHI